MDPEDGSFWIGGLVIDADRQGEGNGRAAIAALLQRFRDAGAVEAALSYQPENGRARALYASLGFRETGELAEGETVARLVIAWSRSPRGRPRAWPRTAPAGGRA